MIWRVNAVEQTHRTGLGQPVALAKLDTRERGPPILECVAQRSSAANAKAKRADASAVALRVRLAAEATATRVLDETGRALGATPFCRDPRFARMAADLPVFLRQSHAERDCAALGERVLAHQEGPAWPL